MDGGGRQIPTKARIGQPIHESSRRRPHPQEGLGHHRPGVDPLRPTGFATRRPACRTTTAQQTTRTYTASSDVRAHSAWRSPMSIKGPSRRRGGCAGKAVGLIRGDLHGGPRCPSASFGAFVGWCGTAMLARASLAAEKSAEAVLPAGIVDGGWEGPNAKPSARTFVLVIVAMTAANPARGLAGRGRG